MVCIDVKTEKHNIPDVKIHPQTIKIIMISEAPSSLNTENFYYPKNNDYMKPTIQIMQDAGLNISTINEITDLGIYITTAVKCPKIGMSISTDTIRRCSSLLEKEIELFPNVGAIILNGDVAIKSINYIYKKKTGEKIIPNGSTYKIRKGKYCFENIQFYPSYILTGKNILIEKSKRKMITEDIFDALEVIKMKVK